MLEFGFDHIQEKPQRGYSIHQITAYQADQKIGYIRVSFINSDLCKKYLPTPWHYMSLYHGWCLPLEDSALWKKAHLYARKSPASKSDTPYWMLENVDIANAEIQEDLRKLEKHYRTKMQEDIDIRGNRPIIEYVQVEEPFRRRGFGTQLYIEMGRFLSEAYNLALYASSPQSAAAKAVWASMLEKGLPVKHVSFLGKETLLLDFRKG